MTHYLQLITQNQPFNLILFLILPLLFLCTLVISELIAYALKKETKTLSFVLSYVSIIGGAYCAVIFLYLFLHMWLPLSLGHGWRNHCDAFTLTMYLLSMLPMVFVSLIELDLLYTTKAREVRAKWRTIALCIALVMFQIALVSSLLVGSFHTGAPAPNTVLEGKASL